MADVTAGLPTLPAPATRFVSRLSAAPPLPPAPPDPNMFVSRLPTGTGGTTTPTGVGVYPPAIAAPVTPAAAAMPAAGVTPPTLGGASPFTYPTGAAPGVLGVGLPGTTDLGAGLNLPPLPGAVPDNATAGTVPNPGTTPGLGSIQPRTVTPGSAATVGLPGLASNGVSDENGVEVIRGNPAAAAVAGGAPVGPYGMQDPTQGTNAGFDAQTSRANDFMNQALQYIQGGQGIFEQATRGRAIGNILHAVVGPNNQGQVAGQGVDALNSALGGVADAGQMAAAQEYGAGTMAGANEYGADVNAQTQAAQRAQAAQQFALTPRPIGSHTNYSAGGIPTDTSSDFAIPGGVGPNGQVIPGGMIVPPSGAAPAARAGGPVEGSTTTVNGQVYRIVNGQPTLVPTPGNR